MRLTTCDGDDWFQFENLGQRAINQDPRVPAKPPIATATVRSISSTTAAARSEVGRSDRKRGRRRDDLIDEKIHADTSSSSRPTIAAAAAGVIPALTSEPRALEVPTISPARRSEKDISAAGSSFSLSSSTTSAPKGLSKAVEHLSKRFSHRRPCSLFGDQSRGNSVQYSRCCARKRSLKRRAKLSGGAGPKRLGSRSPGTTKAPSRCARRRLPRSW